MAQFFGPTCIYSKFKLWTFARKAIKSDFSLWAYMPLNDFTPAYSWAFLDQSLEKFRAYCSLSWLRSIHSLRHAAIQIHFNYAVVECRWSQFNERQIFSRFSVDATSRSVRRRRICVSFAKHCCSFIITAPIVMYAYYLPNNGHKLT